MDIPKRFRLFFWLLMIVAILQQPKASEARGLSTLKVKDHQQGKQKNKTLCLAVDMGIYEIEE
jgi:hypothetical protein